MNAKKIVRAIKTEQEYLNDVVSNASDIRPLIDRLADVGFNSLEEYFNDKREYKMSCALCGKVYYVPPSQAMITLRQMIQNEETGIVSVYTNETCVHAGNGKDSTLDEEYCAEHNIPIYQYDSYGGNIVATEGDYSIAILVNSDVDISSNFILTKMKSLLDNYIDNVTIDGNDIMIDGKKVAGSTSYKNDDVFFFICHVSFSEKRNLITRICGKPATGKEVGCINSDVLSCDEFVKEMLSWLQGL